MKNNILDDIFHDKLRDNLEEGEVVVWDGKPRFTKYSSLISTGSIFFLSGINLLLSISDEDYWLISFWSALIILSIVKLFFRQKKTRYLITNQRVIFQLPKWRKTEVHSLPLNQLGEVVVKEKDNNNGTIELLLKRPYTTKIKTIDIRSSSRRKNPTLELIENEEEVKNYIIQGIKDK